MLKFMLLTGHHFFYHSVSIVHLEMLNVFIALQVWAKHFTNHTVVIHCDNAAVVSVLNSHKTRDMYLLACCRNIWLLLAQYNIRLVAVHVPGSDNIIADALSRWNTLTPKLTNIMLDILKQAVWHSVLPKYFHLDWNI